MTAETAGEAKAAAREWAGDVARRSGLVPLTVETETHGNAMPHPIPMGTRPLKNEEQLVADRHTVVMRLPDANTRDEVTRLKDALLDALAGDDTLGDQVRGATLDGDVTIDHDPSQDFPGKTWRLQVPVVTYRVIPRPPGRPE